MKKLHYKGKKIEKALESDKRFKPISREEALAYLTAEMRKRERLEKLLKDAAMELYLKDMEIESHKMYLVALAISAMEVHDVDKLFFSHEDMKEQHALYEINLEFADERQNSVYLSLREKENAEDHNTPATPDKEEQ